MIHVSALAAQRFVERVEPCTLAEAHERILSHQRALEKAAAFGCQVIRCGRWRIIMEGFVVVTVFGDGQLPRQCRSSLRIGGEA